MQKADYSKIANMYDQGSYLTESNLTHWVELIRSYIPNQSTIRLLDLGCGTGKFSIPLSYRLGYRVTGLDASKAMLNKAMKKDMERLIQFIVGDAYSLPFLDDYFDAIFMSHLIHHLDSPIKMLQECFRTIGKNGIVLIRYGSIEQIEDDVVHRFFPGCLELDKQRTPKKEDVENYLKKAGFKRIVTNEVVQQSFNSSNERVESIKNRSISILNLITDEEFEAGLRKLQGYQSAHNNDPWLLQDKINMCIGYKD